MEKIVLVDDDADIRRVVELRLRLAGFQVLTASDGETGLQLIRAEKPPAPSSSGMCTTPWMIPWS
jgi:DNA-binding response OmpR family regulator